MVLTAVKGVLVVCAWVVCYLHATSPLIRIFEEINIRTLVESMVPRLDLSRRVKIMNVTETLGDARLGDVMSQGRCVYHSQSGYILLSWPGRHY